jgi:hypothetical protein
MNFISWVSSCFATSQRTWYTDEWQIIQRSFWEKLMSMSIRILSRGKLTNTGWKSLIRGIWHFSKDPQALPVCTRPLCQFYQTKRKYIYPKINEKSSSIGALFLKWFSITMMQLLPNILLTSGFQPAEIKWSGFFLLALFGPLQRGLLEAALQAHLAR